MAVVWKIPLVEYDLSSTQGGVDYTNVIKIIHYSVSDTDEDGNTGKTGGAVAIDATDLATDWVDYASFTEEQVIIMAKNALGAEQVLAIEAKIADEISAKATPTISTGVPW